MPEFTKINEVMSMAEKGTLCIIRAGENSHAIGYRPTVRSKWTIWEERIPSYETAVATASSLWEEHLQRLNGAEHPATAE